MWLKRCINPPTYTVWVPLSLLKSTSNNTLQRSMYTPLLLYNEGNYFQTHLVSSRIQVPTFLGSPITTFLIADFVLLSDALKILQMAVINIITGNMTTLMFFCLVFSEKIRKIYLQNMKQFCNKKQISVIIPKFIIFLQQHFLMLAQF